MPAPAFAPPSHSAVPVVATTASARPRLASAVAAAGVAGAAQGALLYGGVIALLHALHNRAPAGDALVLLGWSLLLYGLWAGIAAAGTMLAWRLLGGPLSRLGRRRRPIAAAAGADAEDSPTAAGQGGAAGRPVPERSAGAPAAAAPHATRDLWLATAPFHLVFWVLAASYGLTYDESPAWVTAAPQMALWLTLRSAVVAAVTLAAAWGLARLTVAAQRLGRLALAAGVLVAVLVAAHLGAALLRPAGSAAKPPAPPAAAAAPGALPVALVAIDGADWRVIQPLVDAGRMPNLARLMAEGAWGPLATITDSNSAVIWASIYTGREPADHGILDFYTLRLAGMGRGVYPVHRTFFKELVLRLQGVGLADLTPIDRSQVGAPLLWEVAQARGRSLGLVDGYYYSYPAPATVDPASYYVAYGADTVWQQGRGRAPEPQVAARYAAPPELFAELGPVLARPDFEWQSAGLLALLERRGQPDLVALYTHEPDSVQHASWRHLEPNRYFGVDADGAAARDRIVPFHLALDAFLGELRARLRPDTVLILASDHGHSATLAHSMDTQHRHGPPGILVVHGPAVQPGRVEGAHVMDLFPTVLHLLGLPVPDDGAGRVLVEALRPERVAAHPVQRVASWDGLPRSQPASPPGGERQQDEIEKLKSLGYIR